MPTVHTHYVTYNRKGGRRLHAGTATDDIVTPLETGAEAGEHYEAWAPPVIEWTDEHGKHAADFAFWSVVGAQGGASVTTDQSLDVTVGSSEMQAAAWYLPAGGNGNGGPAFYIDAFDVNEGRFFNEDFVTVSPDASLAANANETGVVRPNRRRKSRPSGRSRACRSSIGRSSSSRPPRSSPARTYAPKPTRPRSRSPSTRPPRAPNTTRRARPRSAPGSRGE